MFRHDILVKLFAKLKQLKIVQALQQECGSILVFTAVGIPILLALIGFGFDVGNLYMHKARLQNVADAAALAGARAYIDNLDTTKGGTVTNGDTPSNPNHANDVAREYVAKNSINLPNDIYHDFNSLMIRESDESNTLYPNKAFYRIGLYESVPLYFLPIIKGVGKTQKVRAEAIAIAIPGETTTTTTPGGSTTTTTTAERKPSIFDNLFTFSEYLFVSDGVEYDGTIKKVFIGDMVYTHYNGSAESGSTNSSKFFDNSTPGPGNDREDNPNNYSFASSGNSASGVINDPTIDTFQNTTAYKDAFYSKLIAPHVDITDQNFNLTGDGNINNSCEYNIEGQSVKLRKMGNDYYPLDENGCTQTITYGGKTYDVCYRLMPPGQWNSPYVLCAKQQEPTATSTILSEYDIKTTTSTISYLINQNNKITNCYIQETTTSIKHQWYTEGPYTETAARIKIGNTEYDLTYNSSNNYFNYSNSPLDNSVLSPESGVSLNIPVAQSSFKQRQNSGGTSNIFHASKQSVGGSPNLTVNVTATGDENNLLYIIVDEDITQLQIHTTSNSRPVVVAYFAHTDQIKFDVSGNEFKGVIYAPYANLETSNFKGTFKGNIIARNINISAGQGATWIQHNYLKNDSDIQAVTNRIEQNIEDAHDAYNALTKEEKEALQNEITNAYITEILNSQNEKQKAKLYGELFPERYEDYKTEVLKNNKDFGHSELFISWNELSDANKYDWGGLGTNLYTELYNKLNANEKTDSVMIEKLKEKILDTDFYNNKLTYVDKQSGYRAWKTLYEKYQDKAFKDILWPWNTNSKTTTQEGGQTVTTTTPDNIRLINPRVEANPFTIYGIQWKML